MDKDQGRDQDAAGEGLPERRRDFLRGLGLAAVGAGAAAATAVVAPAGAEAAEAPEEQAKGRYRDNEYVKHYYHLNRL